MTGARKGATSRSPPGENVASAEQSVVAPRGSRSPSPEPATTARHTPHRTPYRARPVLPPDFNAAARALPALRMPTLPQTLAHPASLARLVSARQSLLPSVRRPGPYSHPNRTPPTSVLAGILLEILLPLRTLVVHFGARLSPADLAFFKMTLEAEPRWAAVGRLERAGPGCRSSAQSLRLASGPGRAAGGVDGPAAGGGGARGRRSRLGGQGGGSHQPRHILGMNVNTHPRTQQPTRPRGKVWRPETRTGQGDSTTFFGIAAVRPPKPRQFA